MPISLPYFRLADEKSVHQIICEIYRPDDLSFTTPQYTFTNEASPTTAKFSSTPSAKGTESVTTELKFILNSSLANRLIISRQFISWKARISSVSFSGTVKSKLTLFTGIVTSANLTGINTTIEVTSQAILLKGRTPIILSNNCPLIFGSFKCTQNKNRIWTTVLSQANSVINLNPPVPLTPNSSFLYAAEVGDQVYKILSFRSSTPSTVDQITLETFPLARPDYLAIVRTCDQTIQQCRKYGNSVRYAGSVLPRSPLATR